MREWGFVDSLKSGSLGEGNGELGGLGSDGFRRSLLDHPVVGFLNTKFSSCEEKGGYFWASSCFQISDFGFRMMFNRQCL